MEKGNIRLIGATTENPSFEIISALLSRSRVYVLKPLTEEQIVHAAAESALADEERGLGAMKLRASDDVLQKIASYSSGDARSAYNVLEVAAALAKQRREQETGRGNHRRNRARCAAEAGSAVRQAGRRALQPDLGSAQIGAQQRSGRGACTGWARMLEAGEDPLYVARRVVRMAVEDIGLADPNALALCMAARDAVDFIGMPEGNLALAQAVVYLAVAPKSNALYSAYGDVQRDVERTAAEPVPLHLRNAPTAPDEEHWLRPGIPVRARTGRQSRRHAMPA